MWKFHNFFITQILCEIKTGEFRGAKPAIFTYLEALNFNLYEILHFLMTENYQIEKIQSLQMGQKGRF